VTREPMPSAGEMLDAVAAGLPEEICGIADGGDYEAELRDGLSA
jgi:hypothetical protein